MWCWTDLGMVAPCQVGVELKACEELAALLIHWRKEEGRKIREGFGPLGTRKGMTLELDFAHAYSRIPSRRDGLFGSLQSWSTRQTWPGQVAFTAGRAHEMETWQPLWMARKEGEELQPLPLGPVVERLQVTEMMSVLKTCNWCTGFGLDQLHTRHLALCSDRCFHLLGSCFFVAEEEGLRASAKDSIDCFPLTVPSSSAHLCMLAQAEVNRWHSARRQSPRVVVRAPLRGFRRSACGRSFLAGDSVHVCPPFPEVFFFTACARELFSTMC